MDRREIIEHMMGFQELESETYQFLKSIQGDVLSLQEKITDNKDDVFGTLSGYETNLLRYALWYGTTCFRVRAASELLEELNQRDDEDHTKGGLNRD